MELDLLNSFLQSWETKEGIYYSNDELLAWINGLNNEIYVNINEIEFSEMKNWELSPEGFIRHSSGGFFSIVGLETIINNRIISQPIINQAEIGMLGIIAKKIDGVLYFLMQAKIEPGNLNKIQISPTVQATKSNFTQVHNGRVPKYIEYFLDAHKHKVILDQLQSEQASRFLGKRNRNIMILVNEEIELHKQFRWMTLGQLKEMLKYDNLVNMDTRTVLSCIPFSRMWNSIEVDSKKLITTIKENEKYLKLLTCSNNNYSKFFELFNTINNKKMFSESISKLKSLKTLENWKFNNWGIYNINRYDFSVIFCEIEIEGREVRKWSQPLFKAEGKATFGIIINTTKDGLMVLVQLVSEIGSFDVTEIGPSIQLEYHQLQNVEEWNDIDRKFFELIQSNRNVVCDVMLSEEGGRFYCEENRNIIVKSDIEFEPPIGYFWVSFSQLNEMIQFNNVVNIQLRNLLSLLEV